MIEPKIKSTEERIMSNMTYSPYHGKEIPKVGYWKADETRLNDNNEPIITICKDDGSFVYPIGDSIIRMNFSKMFGQRTLSIFNKEPDIMERYETFIIKRDAYGNNIDLICQHIDYFMTFFDTDKELPLIYLHMKEIIDDGKFNLTPIEFEQMLIRNFVLQSNIKQNIYNMIDVNNYIDVTVDPATGRKFDGPDDFTNEDARRLLAVSLSMKLAIPLIEQYRVTNEIYKAGYTDIVEQLMIALFYQFACPPSDSNKTILLDTHRPKANRPKKPWERKKEEKKKTEKELALEETDVIMLKLYKFVNDRVKKHKKNNRGTWGQQEALRGLTEVKKEDELISKYIFHDNLFKLNFFHRMVSLLQSIVETQLRFTIISLKYKKNPIELGTEPDANGLTDADKLDQTLAKVDETLIIQTDIAMNDLISRTIQEVGEISEDEIAYYRIHWVRSKDSMQEMLIKNYFAKLCLGFTELKNMSERARIILLIAMKRILKEKGSYEMSWFLSANTVGKVSNRLLQNAKFLNKLKMSPKYKRLKEEKYGLFINSDQPDPILAPISRILNNTHTFVEYDAPELLGQIIEFDEDIAANECMEFIDSI